MLELRGLHIQAGDFRVQDVSLHVGRGEYFVLMGPTGSGKSLLVKAVCGLLRVAGGTVRIGGRDVTSRAPRDRQVGYVPQESGLFPHLRVERNIAFPLEVAGGGRRAARRRIAPVVETLGIAHLLDRWPTTLSGGETQKVALARALARRPAVLVLDEPVSALDEPTRRETCRLLRRVQREFGLATVHVCHATDEARAVSDRVGVMHAGRLVQTGPLEALLLAPADEHVAWLLGVPTGRADSPLPAQRGRTDAGR